MTGRQKSKAVQRLKVAKKALRENQRKEISAGITEETEEFLNLNEAVIQAESDVPWWRR